MRISSKLAWLAAAGLAVSACTTSDAPLGPAAGPGTALPRVTSVTVDSSAGPIFRTLSLSLDEAGPVEVEYWTPGAPRLRVTSQSSTAEHAILLPRLRAVSTYSFEARGIGWNLARGAPWSGSFTTDSLPPDLASVRFRSSGTPTVPVIMLELHGRFGGFVAVDEAGKVVWYRSAAAPLGFARRANGNFALLDWAHNLEEISPDGRVVSTLFATPTMRMHHDIVETPWHTLLFLTYDTATVNETVWTGDAIWEWDPDRQTAAKRWSTFDALSPAIHRGWAGSPADWLHANSLAIGPRGNVIVSFLFFGVISIAPGFGPLEWILDGPHSTFTMAPGAVAYGQHTAAEVEPNRILVFANETYNSDPARNSRALEIVIDPETRTASVARDFAPQPGIWAPYVGSARRLDDGNTLVDFGLAPGVGGGTGPIAIYEVTPSGDVVWKLQVSGPLVNYRATPLQSIAGEEVVGAEPDTRPRLGGEAGPPGVAALRRAF